MQKVTTSRFLKTMVRGPGGHLQPTERRERRAAISTLRRRTDGAPQWSAPTLLVFEDAYPHQLKTRRSTRWSRVMCRLFATLLDRQLAEGRAPESHPLLAARARTLVTPAERQKLAYSWVDLLAKARRPPSPSPRRIPINRSGILANEPNILILLNLLVAPTPGNVRGIALMSSLLADGSGPLYRVCDRPADLGGTLLEANALLGSSEF
jgi:hypothetical protein